MKKQRSVPRIEVDAEGLKVVYSFETSGIKQHTNPEHKIFQNWTASQDTPSVLHSLGRCESMFPLTNSLVHSVTTRNKHYLHRPNAKLSCFQKSTFYSGIRIFYTLPNNPTSLKNDKSKFKEALRIYKKKLSYPVD